MKTWTAAEIIRDEIEHARIGIICPLDDADACRGTLDLDAYKLDAITRRITDRLRDAGHLPPAAKPKIQIHIEERARFCPNCGQPCPF